MLDLHCHLLPGLDDGPPELAAAVELARGLEALGFAEVVPTPHQKAGAWAPTTEEAEAARAALRAALAAAGCALEVHPAAGENMWDELFLARHATAAFPCYPSGRAFLLELPPTLTPPSLAERLFELRVAGRLPVIAHVERYLDLDRERLRTIGRSAALLVNLSSLGSGAGFFARRRARALVEAGLVHAVATDAHSAADLPALRTGLRWLQDHLGEEAERLLSGHPRSIIAGDLPEPLAED